MACGPHPHVPFNGELHCTQWAKHRGGSSSKQTARTEGAQTGKGKHWHHWLRSTTSARRRLCIFLCIALDSLYHIGDVITVPRYKGGIRMKPRRGCAQTLRTLQICKRKKKLHDQSFITTAAVRNHMGGSAQSRRCLWHMVAAFLLNILMKCIDDGLPQLCSIWPKSKFAVTYIWL